MNKLLKCLTAAPALALLAGGSGAASVRLLVSGHHWGSALMAAVATLSVAAALFLVRVVECGILSMGTRLEHSTHAARELARKLRDPDHGIQCQVLRRLRVEGFCGDADPELRLVDVRAGDGPPAWAPENIWDEHPDHPVEEWTSEVRNGDTRNGYIAWVCHRIDTEHDDGE